MMTPARRGLAVGVCTLSTFIVNVDVSAYQVALTQIRDTLPATFAQGQWILSGYSLTLAALVVAAGALGDRFDKRGLLVSGLSVYILGSVLTALAPNAFELIAARVFAAIGASILVPVGLGMVRVLARSSQELQRFTGVWGAVVGLGMAIGPLVGGFISGAFGWRLIAVATAVLAAGFAVLAIAFLPSTGAQMPRRQDWSGIALLGIATFGLVGLFIALGQRGLLIAFGLLVAVVGIVVYLLGRRRRLGVFPIPERAWCSTRFRTAIYVAVTNYFCVGGAIFLLATGFLEGTRQLPVLAAGACLVPLAIGYAVGARLSPVIMSRSGPLHAIAIAGLLMFTASFTIAALIAADGGVAAVSFVAALLGAGMGMANTPTNVLAISELPADYAAVSGAFASVARQVGQAMGIAVCGSAYALAAAAHWPKALPWAALLVAAAGVTCAGVGAVSITRPTLVLPDKVC